MPWPSTSPPPAARSVSAISRAARTLTAELLDSGYPLTCKLVGVQLDDDLSGGELAVEVRWPGWGTGR
jgi:hypothetical protein